MTIITILLILAFVFFVLAAAGWPNGNIGWIGLALWVLTEIIGKG